MVFGRQNMIFLKLILRRSYSILFVLCGIFVGSALMAQPVPLKNFGDRKRASFSFTSGMAFGAHSNAIQLEPKQIIKIQNAFLESLERQSPPEMSKPFKSAASKNLAEADRIWLNAVEIGVLNSKRASAHQSTIATSNFSLLSRYADLYQKPIVIDELVNGRIPSWVDFGLINLGQINWGGIFFPQLGGGYIYARSCARAGVPIPPPFTASGSSQWQAFGPIPFSILNPGQTSEVYAYFSPKGLCMALPIRDVANKPTYDALGVICQGLSTGANTSLSNSKACYWDNANQSMTPTGTYPIDGPTFLAPPFLPSNNQCSDCHAGENSFIVHTSSPSLVNMPSSALFATKPLWQALSDYNASFSANNFLTRNSWFKPMLDLTWPQNPERPNSYLPDANGNYAGPCSGCHNPTDAGRLPDVTGTVGVPSRDKLIGYCFRILSGEITSGVGLTSGVGPHLVGPMYSHVDNPIVPQMANISSLYADCLSVVPTYLMMSTAYPAGFPGADENDWVNW
jgi:hypothetical protein